MFRTPFLILLILLGFSGAESRAAEPKRESRKTEAHTQPPVRNLIYMIGDGMGLGHVSMLMIENGYAPTAFQSMENVALITSYSANNRVTDSAAAGTALATGHKTDNGKLGVTPDNTPVASILEQAVEQGMHGGFVVTCEVQHATPGAFYAHVAHRREGDQISWQLAEAELDIALGGGREGMLRPDSLGRTPKERLLERGYQVVETLDEIETIDCGRVVGLLSEGHLPEMQQGRGDYLPRATRQALSILEQNTAECDRGFVLMVEGSQIDFESHANDTEGILLEMQDFEAAIREAMTFVDSHPGTLLVVTADHETGGLSMPSGNKDFTTSESGIHYRYGTTSHTGVLLPVYLYGTGAEQINGVMDNTDLARRLMELVLRK